MRRFVLVPFTILVASTTTNVAEVHVNTTPQTEGQKLIREGTVGVNVRWDACQGRRTVNSLRWFVGCREVVLVKLKTGVRYKHMGKLTNKNTAL